MYTPETVTRIKTLLRKNKYQIITSGKTKKRKKGKQVTKVFTKKEWLEKWEKWEQEKGFKKFHEFISKGVLNLYVKYGYRGNKQIRISTDKKEELINHYFLTMDMINNILIEDILFEVLKYDFTSLIDVYYMGKIFSFFIEHDDYNKFIEFLRDNIKQFLKPEHCILIKVTTYLSEHEREYFQSKLNLIVIYANGKEFQSDQGKTIDLFNCDERLSPPWQNQIFIPYYHFQRLFIPLKIAFKYIEIPSNRKKVNEILNELDNKMTYLQKKSWNNENMKTGISLHRKLTSLRKRIKTIMNILPYIHSKYFRPGDLVNIHTDKRLLNEYLRSLWKMKNLSLYYKKYFILHVVFPVVFLAQDRFFNKVRQVQSIKQEDGIEDYEVTDSTMVIFTKSVIIKNSHKHFMEERDFFGFINNLPDDIWNMIWGIYFTITFRNIWNKSAKFKFGIPDNFNIPKTFQELKQLFSVYWNRCTGITSFASDYHQEKRSNSCGMSIKQVNISPSMIINTNQEYIVQETRSLGHSWSTVITIVIKECLREGKLLNDSAIRQLIDKRNTLIKKMYIDLKLIKRLAILLYYEGNTERHKKYFKEVIIPSWDELIKQKKRKRREWGL